MTSAMGRPAIAQHAFIKSLQLENSVSCANCIHTLCHDSVLSPRCYSFTMRHPFIQQMLRCCKCRRSHLHVQQIHVHCTYTPVHTIICSSSQNGLAWTNLGALYLKHGHMEACGTPTLFLAETHALHVACYCLPTCALCSVHTQCTRVLEYMCIPASSTGNEVTVHVSRWLLKHGTKICCKYTRVVFTIKACM